MGGAGMDPSTAAAMGGGNGVGVGMNGMSASQPANSGMASTTQGQPGDTRQHYIQKQQRWLLFLRHCAKCQQGEEQCQFGRSCRVGKELWQHILSCSGTECPFPRCTSSKDLLKHHQKCQVGGGSMAGVHTAGINGISQQTFKSASCAISI